MTVATQHVTVADLLRLDPDARVEVVEGEIVEMTPVGGLHNWIAKNIMQLLDVYAREHKSGLVFTDSLLYILSASDAGIRTARVPDVSFVAKHDIPSEWDFERPFPGAPTLAVEVMSPDDQLEDVEQKVRDYFSAGTSEVWLVLPRQETVYRHFRSESVVHLYRAQATMDVGTLFPGLTLDLADIFRRPELD